MMLSLTVCSLPSDSGPCSTWQIKYFFDKRVGHCRRFYYGGCGGNDNMFDTMTNCSRLCYVKHDDVEVRDDDVGTTPKYPTNSTDACLLESDGGPCSDYTIKWHFNPQDSRCRRFWYGGCKGNDNRFATEEECEAKCLKKGQ